MITLKTIIPKYGMPINRTFKSDINKYIELPEIQTIIHRALAYNLSDKDRNWLYQYGNHKGKFPHLNYLCTIYIHPITHAQNCIRLYQQIMK